MSDGNVAGVDEVSVRVYDEFDGQVFEFVADTEAAAVEMMDRYFDGDDSVPVRVFPLSEAPEWSDNVGV